MIKNETTQATNTEGSTMNTINWTTAAGAAITMTLSTEYDLDSQGRRKSRGYKTVEIKATVNGEAHKGYRVRTVKHDQYVAAFGTIGMDEIQYAKFCDIEARLTDSIKEHNQAIDDHACAMDEVSARTRQIEVDMACGEEA